MLFLGRVVVCLLFLLLMVNAFDIVFPAWESLFEIILAAIAYTLFAELGERRD